MAPSRTSTVAPVDRSADRPICAKSVPQGDDRLHKLILHGCRLQIAKDGSLNTSLTIIHGLLRWLFVLENGIVPEDWSVHCSPTILPVAVGCSP